MHNAILVHAHQNLAAKGAIAMAVEVLGVYEQQRGAGPLQRNVPRLQAAQARVRQMFRSIACVSISELQPVSHTGLSRPQV